MNREGRGRFRAYSAGSHPKGEVNPARPSACSRACTTRPTGLRSKSWDEFARPGRAEARFRVHRLRRRGRRGLPDLARPADDRALGHARSGGGAGLAGRGRPGLRRHLPDAEQPHQPVHEPADGLARQAVAAAPPRRDRPAARGGPQRHEGRSAAGDASLEPPLETFGLAHRLAAEALGTALLLAIVVGSGIMGERLAGGNDAIALLGNTLATGAGLVVLITIFGPISGAHFNPAVTLAFAIRREIAWPLAAAYVAVQVVAGDRSASGSRTPCSPSRSCRSPTKLRDGPSQALRGVRRDLRPDRHRSSAHCASAPTPRPGSSGSTSPPPTGSPPRHRSPIRRSPSRAACSNTFAGIAPSSAPAFIAAQLLGAVAATFAFGWLLAGSQALFRAPRLSRPPPSAPQSQRP